MVLKEFKRAFTPIEVFGLGFSIIGLIPSIACVDLRNHWAVLTLIRQFCFSLRLAVWWSCRACVGGMFRSHCHLGPVV